MATQRLTVASLAGNAATVADALFRSWRVGGSAFNPVTVDRFCSALRANGAALPVIYFCEWVDRWLMGDLVPGPDAVEGRQYQATCLSPSQAIAWADQCGQQFPEQKWLAARLREAAAAWGTVTDKWLLVVIREPLGGTTTDDEVRASLGAVPEWLRGGGNSA